MFHVKQTPLNLQLRGVQSKGNKAMESKKLSEFGNDWDLILDSQDVNYMLDHQMIDHESKQQITGIIAKYDANGYYITEIWATESNAPYLLDSEYMPIDYWRNE